jgi:hypothetical protein
MTRLPPTAALVLAVCLSACGDPGRADAPTSSGTQGPASSAGRTLSRDETAKAEAVARAVIEDQRALVDSASVIAGPGKIEDSNTGHPCTSGRELQIKLIGDFPHAVTTGHPVKPGSPPPAFTIRAMTTTADAESGLACLIGVQTAETGNPEPEPGSTELSVSP